MRRLNKRYEKTLKSVKAQVTCPCSAASCNTCGTSTTLNEESLIKMLPQHRAGQRVKYN